MKDKIEKLEAEVTRLTKELEAENLRNEKMLAAATRALVEDKIENSQWLKENVRIPISMLKPTLLKHMRVEFDGESFRTINTDERGKQVLSTIAAGKLYAEGGVQVHSAADARA